MSTRQHPLSKEEIERAFAAFSDTKTGPICRRNRLAELLNLIYEWIPRGRLDGAFRNRGKHNLIWRDRALTIFFNGPEWESNEPDCPRASATGSARRFPARATRRVGTTSR